MRIAINLEQFHKGKIGGLENYVRNVLAGLTNHQLTVWTNPGAVTAVAEFLPHADIRALPSGEAGPFLENALRTEPFDVFFCPLLVLDPPLPPIPSVVTSPDIQHEFWPEFFPPEVLAWRRRTYGASFRNADAIFTISEFSKRTIADHYKLPPEKLTVVPLDADAVFHSPMEPAEAAAVDALGLPKRFLYFPANFWPHKNHVRLLEALKLVHQAGERDLHLVLTGSASGYDAVAAKAASLGVSAHIRYLGHVPQGLIPEIYRRAEALVFASLFEGFGIPIVEAFHAGAPVVTALGGSTQEVAGDAAIFVDARSPTSIADGILQILHDTDYREVLIRRGRKRAEQFCWAAAIERTEEVLQQVASTRPAEPRPSAVEVSEWPRFGIVTPTYQMAGFLGETIDSILSQDYPHVDYLVMDGGSKDGTVPLLESYGKRIRFISAPDKGQADAVNRGFHQVSGEIFTFLNADDTYLPGALSRAATQFRRLPKAGMIYGGGIHVDIDGKPIGPYATRPYDRDALAGQCFICQPAAFCRRTAFEDAGMLNASLHFALDYDLWLRIAKLYPIEFVAGDFATSRMYRDNKTLSSRKRVFGEIFAAVKTHYGYLPYEWVHGYACHLLDGKDQFFDRSQPSPSSYGLALAIGLYHNPRHWGRYIGEWRQGLGFGAAFTGRWEDGWISRVFETDLHVPPGAEQLRIRGQHQAPFARLELRASLNGRAAGDHRLDAQNNFEWTLPVPQPAPERIHLRLEASKTFRPKQNGDYRRLSCRIEPIQFLPTEPAR